MAKLVRCFGVLVLVTGMVPAASAQIVVQPTFVPIIGPPPPGMVYGPSSTPGWDVQRANWQAGTVSQDNGIVNYTLHATQVPVSSSLHTPQAYLNHGGNGVVSSADLGMGAVGGGADDFTVRGNAYINFTQPGNYTIYYGADDTTRTVANTLVDGVFLADTGCCVNANAPLTITEPGMFPFDFVFGERGGGEWFELGISGPGINGTVALGDIQNGSPEAFTFEFQEIDLEGGGPGGGGPGGGGAGGAVPEPASIAIWSLLGIALTGLGYHRFRRG